MKRWKVLADWNVARWKVRGSDGSRSGRVEKRMDYGSAISLHSPTLQQCYRVLILSMLDGRVSCSLSFC